MIESSLGWARHLPNDDLREMLLGISAIAGNAWGGEPGAVLGRLEAALAGWKAIAKAHTDPPPPEAPARPTTAAAVEAWLKAQRDQYGWHGSNDATPWHTIDGLLDQYRLHADTGTPLDQHVCEGGNVDDCAGCYETAKARQQR